MKSRLLSSITLMALLLVGSSVQPATFEGTTDGYFANPIGPPGHVYPQILFNPFLWGTPITGQSSLTFYPQDFGTELNHWFVVGDLVYENQTVAVGTSPSAVDLHVILDFILPSDGSKHFRYTFALQTTLNAADNPLENADSVLLPYPQTNEIVLEGVKYQLTMGFGHRQDGVITFVDELTAPEGGRSFVQVVTWIQAPDGGPTLALLGGALTALGVARQRLIKNLI
jgi:hypothetical protein